MPGLGTSAHRTVSRPPPFDFPYFSQPKKSTPSNLASTVFTGAPKNLQKAAPQERNSTILGVVGSIKIYPVFYQFKKKQKTLQIKISAFFGD